MIVAPAAAVSPATPGAVDTEPSTPNPVKKIEFKEETPVPKEEQPKEEGEKKKSKKKKKKKSFKSLMSDMIKTDTTVEQERAKQRETLKNVTGGGTFSKMERI